MNFKQSSSKTQAQCKAIRRQPPQGEVWTQRIIKSLDVRKDVVLSLGSGRVMPQVNKLGFQAAEEVFRNSIIIGIPLAGHALPDAKGGQAVSVVMGSVLYAPAAVKNEARPGLFPVNSDVQGIQGEPGVDAPGERVADNLFGTQVFDHGRIQPAHIRGDVGNVAYLGKVGPLKVKLTVEKIRCNRIAMVGVCSGLVGFLRTEWIFSRFISQCTRPREQGILGFIMW